MVNHVSKKGYIWGHIAVIIVYTLIGAILIWAGYKPKIFKIKSEHVVKFIGILLVVVNLLSLVPILMTTYPTTIS